MVSNSEIIDIIKEKTKEHKLNLVIDPVMKAARGSSLLDKSALASLKDFLSVAKLVTPNIDEAAELTGIEIETVEDMKDAAEKIKGLGPENVLIKGGHLEEEKIHNVLLYGNNFIEYETSRVPVSDVHGSGCTFSAAITAELAKGKNLRNAVKKAGDFMIDAIERRLKIGSGLESVNPMANIWKLVTDGEESENILKAAKKLIDNPEFVHIIPEVGTNIAMAPKDAQRKEDVFGLTGRIVKVSGRPYLSGIPAPGGSEHMANLVMSVIKHDHEYRAAMNIRFSEKILKKCRDLGFEIASFDRENEPIDAKTMKWGPDKAIEKFGKVPDIIYDRGAVGKEPMIRILGKKSTEVTDKALQILKELDK